MRKLITLFCLTIASVSYADRLGSLLSGADVVLSTNAVLLVATQTFTGANVFKGSTTVNGPLLANNSVGSLGQVLVSMGDNSAPQFVDPIVSQATDALLNASVSIKGSSNTVTVSLSSAGVNASTVAASQQGSWTVSVGTGIQPVEFLSSPTVIQSSWGVNASTIAASIINFPATQAVTQSGTWTVSQGTGPTPVEFLSVPTVIQSSNGVNASTVAVVILGTPAITQSGTWTVSPGTGTQPVEFLTAPTVITSSNGVNASTMAVVILGTPGVAQSGTWTVNPGTGTTPVFVTGVPATTGGITAAMSAAWTSATALNTTLTLNTTGYGTVLFTVNPSGTIGGGRLNFEVSDDGGTTWYLINLTREQNGTNISSAYFDMSGEIAYAMQANIAGSTNFRVRLNPQITGVATENMRITGFSSPISRLVGVVQLDATKLLARLSDGTNSTTVTSAGALKVDNSAVIQPIISTSTAIAIQAANGSSGIVGYQNGASSVPVNVLNVLTKGTQGSVGLSTQDLKDAGRSFVVLVATAVAGSVSEVIFSFQQNKAGTVTQSVTSYTITSGKTFRIQGLYCSNRDGTTAISWSRFAIRSSIAGATVAASALIFGKEIGDQAALAGATSDFDSAFPDGIEIAGDGTKSIGVTHIDQATTNLVSCTLVGYEY